MTTIDTRLTQLLESIDSYKKPSRWWVVLFCLTHILPILGMLFVLWAHRPGWLREEDANLVRQLFRSLGELIASSYLASAASLVGVFAQAARLRFSPTSRNGKQFAWLACLLAFAAYAVNQVNQLWQFY